MTRPPGSISARTRLALAAGRATAAASRRLGRGRGATVGGGVALRIDPDALRRLAAGRQVALVSATNGKSTTSWLLAEALRTVGAVAHNATGANMAEGLVTTLDADRRAPYAVLETDEAYLGPIAQATRPRAILLMNLSRDYLERGVRSKALARHWQGALAAVTWPCTVVANADDPLVAWAVHDYGDIVWVAGGMWWDVDGEVCRTCRVRLRRDGEDWSCPTCGRARSRPAWWVAEGRVRGPGLDLPLDLRLPGRTSASNALFALAGAAALGVDPARALAAVARVDDVDGRWRPRSIDGRVVRLMLSKNPSSWSEIIERAAGGTDPLVVVMDARGGSGKDCAFLWDAPFERLAGRTVVAAGNRAADVALRMHVAGLEVRVVPDPTAAIRSLPPGPVDVAANYPAFLALAATLGG
jgi:lipid II isoglutaminyl synthase (glutamine-hydrolysing)